MSKYIIELGDSAKKVVAIYLDEGAVWTGVQVVEDLEVLNSDYISEHFGDLQDDAYQKGFEDGKKEAESSEAIEQAKADAFNKGMLFKKEKTHDAFLRGVEKGKAVNDKGCEGCMYQDNTIEHHPCGVCRNAYNNRWKAKDDKIEVGDEVEVLNSGNKYLVAWIAGTSLCGFAHDGVTCRLQPSDVRKTGRHFDIASILEDMRND